MINIEKKLVKYIDLSKINKKNTFKNNIKNINDGDIIEHKKWGKGVVISVIDICGDKELLVKFNNIGEKRLLLSYSPVEIV